MRWGPLPVPGAEAAQLVKPLQEEHLVDLAERPAEVGGRKPAHERRQTGCLTRCQALLLQVPEGRARRGRRCHRPGRQSRASSCGGSLHRYVPQQRGGTPRMVSPLGRWFPSIRPSTDRNGRDRHIGYRSRPVLTDGPNRTRPIQTPANEMETRCSWAPNGSSRTSTSGPAPRRSDRGFNVSLRTWALKRPTPSSFESRRWTPDVLPLDTTGSWCRSGLTSYYAALAHVTAC